MSYSTFRLGESIHRTRSWSVLILVLALALTIVWHSGRAGAQDAGTAASTEPTTVVFNITSGPDDLLRVITAFRVAEEAITSGRRVVLFFNAGGVNVPVKRLPQDLRLAEDRPLWRMLKDLVDRGATVVIARASADALGYFPVDFIDGSRIEPYAGNIFSKMTKNTIVFSY